MSTPKSGLESRASHLLFAGILVSAAVPAAAADDLFLKLEGIQGESNAAGHKDEIEILSYTQSLANSTARVGQAGGAGKTNCNPVTITKFVDRSSPVFMLYVANGRHLTRGVITVRRTGQAPLDYYKLTLDEVMIVEVEQSDTKLNFPNPAPPKAIEKVTLLARRYTWEYMGQTPSGAPLRVPTAWDCVLNAPG